MGATEIACAVIALLHSGVVTHVRHAPFQHRFAYRMWMLSVNIDRVDSIRSRIFRHNRRGLVSLQDRDHGARDGTPLRPWVEAQLASSGLEQFGHSIHFMAMPRVFGFGFNPIAFFFCYDATGTLGAVVHQVKNTFGDQTAYTLPVLQDGATIQQTTGKRMHVSPFFDMRGGYRFSFTAPDLQAGTKDFTLAIRYGTEEAARLTAAMTLKPRPFTDRNLLHLLVTLPFAPLKVVAAIHWQALRLWLRGAVFHSRPQPPTGEIA